MKAFSMLCYLALVDDHGKGWEITHPSYVMEKAYIMTASAEGAYAMLDRLNQFRMLAYCSKWRMPIPEVVEKYEKEIEKREGGNEEGRKS